MIPPTSIDGTDITGATIDGTDVTEITVDGDVVFSAVTGFDLTTLTLGPNISFPAPSGAAGIFVDNAGNHMITGDESTTGAGQDYIQEYSFGTAHDLGTLSFDRQQGPVTDRPTQPDFKPDGTRYAYMDKNGTIFQFDLSTPFNLSSASSAGSYNALSAFNGRSFKYIDGGDKIMYANSSGGFYIDNLSTPYDVTSHSSHTSTNQFISDANLEMNPDGTRLFGFNGTTLNQYSLSTAFDASTISGPNASLSVNVTSGVFGCCFAADGTILYVCDKNNVAKATQ